MNRYVAPATLSFGALLVSSAAFAADGGVASLLNPWAAIASVVYGFLGIALAMIGYKAFEMMLPFDVTKELSEDDNPAVGVLMGAVVLGVCVIMAAAIHG